MWFKCECGNTIHDTSEMLSYKARIINDQDFYKLTDAVTMAGSGGEMSHGLADMAIELLWKTTKVAYQCPHCGRLYIDRGKDQFYAGFTPDNGVSKALFVSREEAKRKGYLDAYWYDDKPEWLNQNGILIADVGEDYSEFTRRNFADVSELKAAYSELLEILKSKGQVRNARFRVNGTRVESMCYEPGNQQ